MKSFYFALLVERIINSFMSILLLHPFKILDWCESLIGETQHVYPVRDSNSSIHMFLRANLNLN